MSPGDVVMLKSGGPFMTVQSVAEETEVGPAANCIWFDDPVQCIRMPHIESFPLACLTKAP